MDQEQHGVDHVPTAIVVFLVHVITTTYGRCREDIGANTAEGGRPLPPIRDCSWWPLYVTSACVNL